MFKLLLMSVELNFLENVTCLCRNCTSDPRLIIFYFNQLRQTLTGSNQKSNLIGLPVSVDTLTCAWKQVDSCCQGLYEIWQQLESLGKFLRENREQPESIHSWACLRRGWHREKNNVPEVSPYVSYSPFPYCLPVWICAKFRVFVVMTSCVLKKSNYWA